MFNFIRPKFIIKEFSLFNRGAVIDYYYLCYYKKKDCPYDKFSHLLFGFKDGKRIVKQWCSWAVKAIPEMKLPGDTIVIRALSSGETVISNNGETPLDILGRAIQSELGYQYIPAIIFKAYKTKQLKQCGDRDGREKALGDTYRLARSCPDLSNRTILIIDDIKTYGTTIDKIAELIKGTFPSAKIYSFTLAQTNCGGDNTSIDIVCQEMKNIVESLN